VIDAALRRLARAAWRPLADRARRQYVAGLELGDALSLCQALARRGITGTVCFWNRPGEGRYVVADAYRAAAAGLRAAALEGCRLSIKAPALEFDGDLVTAVVDQCRRTSVDVHFDSLALDGAERTFALIEAALPQHPGLGCTLPGRWARSVGDADVALELGLRARVVKGEWPDPADPARDPRKGFLAIVDRLAGRAGSVAVATHDAPLAREALHQLRAAGSACELELLLGLPFARAAAVARALDVRVRLYVPYGEAYLPYELARARSEPRVLWWVVRDAAARPSPERRMRQWPPAA